MTIGNAAFYLSLYLTSIHFQGELQTGGHVGGQKSNADQSELDKRWCQIARGPICMRGLIL